MSEAGIRAAIDTIVSAVTSVGQVHDYLRWTASIEDFESVFKTTIGSTDQVCAWMIRYDGFTAERDQFRAGGKEGINRVHQFAIVGIMGVDDSAGTEKTFAALVEAIANALDDAETIRAGTYFEADPAQARVEYRTVAGVLCHYAEVTQKVWEAL